MILRTSSVEYRTDRLGAAANAPPSRMFIQRPSHGSLRGGSAISNLQAATAVQTVGFSAWSGSEWVKKLAQANNMTPETVASLAFDPSNPDKMSVQKDRIFASGSQGRSVEYWFGNSDQPLFKLSRALRNGGYPAPDIFIARSPSESDGFVKIEQQYRGSRLIGAAKKLAGLGVYVCLHDINVVPEKQGQGLGTAMAYVALGDQPQRLQSSLYTAKGNEPMETWAQKYGYKPIDVFEDPDLIDGVSVSTVHYVAESVGYVRDRMEELNPWLTSGKRSSLIRRMVDNCMDDLPIGMPVNPPWE